MIIALYWLHLASMHALGMMPTAVMLLGLVVLVSIAMSWYYVPLVSVVEWL